MDESFSTMVLVEGLRSADPPHRPGKNTPPFGTVPPSMSSDAGWSLSQPVWGWPQSLMVHDREITFAAGRYGMYRFGLDDFNLLED